jgi:uncharacterized protein (DUF1684 family)
MTLQPAHVTPGVTPPGLSSGAAGGGQVLELWDWRRRVAELFAELRRRHAAAEALAWARRQHADAETLAWFRAEKDALFREHPQTPLSPERRPSFQGLAYWPYDPAMRVVARFEAEPRPGPPAGAEVAFSRVGTLRFELKGQALQLGAHWIEGYAGGLFVPFRDATCGSETYGGGRYLVDSIKSADLGSDVQAGTVVLDFNYAYHPSCAYDPRWPCPLAPPENRLEIAIRAGEKL